MTDAPTRQITPQNGWFYDVAPGDEQPTVVGLDASGNVVAEGDEAPVRSFGRDML